jgi:NAD+ kinase
MTVRVLLVPNTLNPDAVQATCELSTWLLGQGFEPVLSTEDAAGVGLADLGVAPADIGEPVLVVALGGDGTILKAVHLLGEVEVPVLGVKFGRLGFLSGASSGSMRDAVATALSGEASIERRATLHAEVVMEGRTVGSYRALNEVVLTRGGSPRVVAPTLSVDGHRLAELRVDGIIVATATGSTAYALSAGGPIVAPGFGGMVIVPVSAHTLNARPIVTDPQATVEISLPDASRAEACIIVDGEVMPCRRTIERVTVSRGSHDVLLVKLGGRDFYETISAEFFGA